MLNRAKVFLDTSILIYAANGKSKHQKKYEIAQGLLTTQFGLSIQVITEFYNQITSHGAIPLSKETAAEWLKLLIRKPCQDMDSRIVMKALEHQKTHNISHSNGLILASAERLGATTLYSEEFTHKKVFGDITAINPFVEQ